MIANNEIPFAAIESANSARYARGWHCFGLVAEITHSIR